MAQVPSDVATHRVAWPGAGQVEGYYGSYAEAKRECDASREYDRRHHQGGPHAVVQKYAGDGEWVTVYPKTGAREEARRDRRPHGPPKPVVVDIECASPREWRWFKNMAIEQGWARATSGEYSLELTDLPENLPERFHQAVQAAGCKIKVLSESVKETVMSSRVRKPIADLIEELKNWLPNYDHGPTDYPTILFRTLAAAPGGDRLVDIGYEPIGNLGWHELDQLGRVLEAIQDKTDVEDLIAGLTEEEEEEREPEPAPAPPPPAPPTRRTDKRPLPPDPDGPSLARRRARNARRR
jgi:hypothetical protein